jgi:hypothetical protein
MKRVISLFLSAVFLCFCIKHVKANEPIVLVETGKEQVYRVRELTQLREKNADTFLLSDGTRECVVYSQDKYYYDEDGLVEIDNTIESFKSEGEDNRYLYRNRAGAMRFYFAENPSVLIENGEKKISFSVIGTNDVAAQIDFCSYGDAFSEICPPTQSCVVYPRAFTSTDIIYSVNNECLKEYIFLSNADAPNEYMFQFDTSDSVIGINEKGLLGVYDLQGNQTFAMGSLFAIDSRGVRTDEVEYSIVEKTEKTTIVSVRISESYLKNTERVFPVLIDPSIMITGETCTYDSFVSSKYPSANYYLSDWLRTGRDDDYNTRRTYIKFDIPSSVTQYIASAQIFMKKYSGASPNVYACRVTSSWNSSTITWNNKPEFDGTYSSGNAVFVSNNWYAFDVTKLAIMWKKGVVPNYGVLIKDWSESGASQWTTFYSSDAASPNKPELRIIYTPYDTTLLAYKENYLDGTYSPRDNYFSSVSSYVINNRGGNVFTNLFESYTHYEMVTRLQSTLIYFIHGHGAQTEVYLGNGNYYTCNSIASIDLPNLRCALLLTCNGGDGGYSSNNVNNNTPVNILERLVICGSDTVIGFEGATSVPACNIFAVGFAEKAMVDGYSVYNAVYYMDNAGAISNLISRVVIGGNTTQQLDR